MSCAAICAPKLVMPHPCCRHCTHPFHPQIASGHPTPCWRCEVEAVAGWLGIPTDESLGLK